MNDSTQFIYSQANVITDNCPTQHIAASWDEFINVFNEPDTIRSLAKGGRYICAPLRVGQPEGKPHPATWRCNELVADTNWLAFDFDKITDLPALLAVAASLCQCVCYHTASSTPDNPHLRIVIRLSRRVTPSEFSQVAFAVGAVFGEPRDENQDRPSQALYLPLVGADSWRYDDTPALCVDMWLPTDEPAPAPAPAPATAVAVEWTEVADEAWSGPDDDDELIRRALRSRGVAATFGGRATFADLWNANGEVLARCYSDPARVYDASSADAALAQLLAFWTGRNCARIERIMQKSALVRDKWLRADYMERTILNAVGRQVTVLTDKLVATTAPKTSNTMFADINEQITLFAGCVYVQSLHRMLVPGGILLKPEQFKATYGGRIFNLDLNNEKTTRDAWEAFTLNLVHRFPQANSVCFKPQEPFGTITERDGMRYVNTYWPVEVPRSLGDTTPFYVHLAKVLPDANDRKIFLSYMAACVQHKGIKFQWAPLLQGVEGNGKTLFTRCVAEALGQRYVHWPNASKLSEKFNGWMLGKLFYGVEDIYVPDHKREVIENLKPMITGGDGLEIESKGVDQISADICGNFMFNSNHKDAIRKTKNDRRFCVLFSAQQRVEDLGRDGMDADYFPDLYAWLRADGYAIVSELLHTYRIDDGYNPATGCQRAPSTTATTEVIRASVGGIEQDVIEAIEEGAPGFCGDFVSSIMLDRFLESKFSARHMSRAKRKIMLEELGYHYHTALHDGRVTAMLLPDCGRARLFVKDDSTASLIDNAFDVAKAYTEANYPPR